MLIAISLVKFMDAMRLQETATTLVGMLLGMAFLHISAGNPSFAYMLRIATVC